MKICLIIVLFIVGNTANSQQLFLYRSNVECGKYVLSRSYQERDKSTISEVIIAETFSVTNKDPICQVTMSNAYIFRTRMNGISSPPSTNDIVQGKWFTKMLKMDLQRGTKLIFDNAVMDLSQVRMEKASQSNMLHFEGAAAAQELNRMGLGLPDDFDQGKADHAATNSLPHAK
ncbi:MAG: hypothetical protein JWR19_2047 [Pedosphaera sp.]|nr:hypothetical protein [Pedosphaera sp.]